MAVGVFGTNGIVSAQHLVLAASEGVDFDLPLKVLTEAYGRIGITIELRRFPAERAIRMANEGKVDGEILRLEGAEQKYPNLIRIPVPIKTDEIVVVTKSMEFAVDGWSSLMPYTVGYIRGIKVIEMNLVEGTHAEAVNSGEQAYKKLEAGRTDVVVDALSQAQLQIKTLGMHDLIVLAPPLQTLPFFHYVHVKNQHIVKPLTEALQQMEDEGLIQHPSDVAPSPSP